MKTRKIILLLICAVCFVPILQAQVPVYNSLPTAQATVFLDFDGQLVEGTGWNYMGPLDCSASGLTATQVTEIFNRISEDYRPFNINITTDSAKYWAAPALQRMRVIFTTTYSWYGLVGGTSWIGSFTWGDDTPCFVFSSLLNYNSKNIAEAGAHEIGHTLGLCHQASYDLNCNKLTEYNSGIGAGETSWAPIMGVGYSRNMTLWNNGANPFGCTDIQDDLQIITSQNGFGYRPDDHDSSLSLATVVNFTNNSFQQDGIIEQNTDKDAFRIIIPEAGHFHLDALPYSTGNNNAGSDLDLQVNLFDQQMNKVTSFNPAQVLSVSIDTTLNPGVYYLQVEGQGNQYAPQYASLGAYSLQASYSPFIILPLHQLSLKGQEKPDGHYLEWQVKADEKMVKQEMEVSVNGSVFTLLKSLPADQRSLMNRPETDGQFYYRIKAGFDNGQSYYSNIITINSIHQAKPKLQNNIVQSVLKIQAPGKYAYTITDINGRPLKKGMLAEGMNSIEIAGTGQGMYFIQYCKENAHSTEKFIKP